MCSIKFASTNFLVKLNIYVTYLKLNKLDESKYLFDKLVHSDVNTLLFQTNLQALCLTL